MASTNFEAIFGQIEKDWVDIYKNAGRSAATKAQKDIQEKADKFIQEYYASYSPRVYKRQNALYKLVTPYYKEKGTGNGLQIEFGVKYDASKIKGIHKSNSWYHQSGGAWVSKINESGFGSNNKFNEDGQDNGIPEPEWITNNFLDGWHPWAQWDAFSPDEKMQKFFDTQLDDIVGGYMNEALLGAIRSYF